MQTDFNLRLGKHLALIRDAMRMSQKEVAEKSGIDQGALSRIERGIGNPSIKTVERIAEAMDCEINFTLVQR